MPFGMWALVDPHNQVLDGDLDPLGEGAIFGMDIHGHARVCPRSVYSTTPPSSSSSCGLSEVERSRSHESTPCLTVLGSSIGGCQTNVERCKVRLHRPEPCMTRSAGRTITVSWQRGQAGPKGSTVIHGWISTGNMAKKT